MFLERGAPVPQGIKLFRKRMCFNQHLVSSCSTADLKTLSGVLLFASAADALKAIALTNHYVVKNEAAKLINTIRLTFAKFNFHDDTKGHGQGAPAYPQQSAAYPPQHAAYPPQTSYPPQGQPQYYQ
jgi:hypothetical protein